ncbi:MAG: GNAT family N-acetyltransferase [Gammaproteobacteria bacterium]|nr:GNAT family N-acetyltransferase [Gammaproteobacteria bacterium]
MTPDIRSPANQQEWDNYFDLRWRILRQPWGQPRGSEKDQLEQTSIHRIAVIDNRLIAAGRIHVTENNCAQIRYMAVEADFRRCGIGHKILHSLEQAALRKKIYRIELNAREEAVSFYQNQQYVLTAPAHTLYEQIKHFKMVKCL